MTFTIACLLTLISVDPLQRFEATQPHMGTSFAISLYAPDRATADKCFAAAFNCVAELNRIMSDYDPESEVSRLSSSSPHATPVQVSDDLFKVLWQAHRLSVETEGAFDVTVGPLTKLWRRARRRKQLPDATRLAKARASVGYKLLKLGPDDQTAQLVRAGMRLDLGGIAKGHAVDEAMAAIRTFGVTQVLVNAGGDIVIGDAPPGELGWKIGVAALQPDEPPSQVLTLVDCSVATSGDAWQYVELGGKRYSHILDPRTGLGLTRRSSVTIIAPSGLLADSLASAVSVLGPERGIELLDKSPTISGVMIVKAGAETLTHTSSEFPSVD
ncbi:MAG: ApbE family lipoprotein [Planctomycetaceae bacterium]|nr:ApbE family lipoprotein [Planctomycetaceae bacterium]